MPPLSVGCSTERIEENLDLDRMIVSRVLPSYPDDI